MQAHAASHKVQVAKTEHQRTTAVSHRSSTLSYVPRWLPMYSSVGRCKVITSKPNSHREDEINVCISKPYRIFHTSTNQVRNGESCNARERLLFRCWNETKTTENHANVHLQLQNIQILENMFVKLMIGIELNSRLATSFVLRVTRRRRWHLACILHNAQSCTM